VLHIKENKSREGSWKHLEWAPLCFQVAFSLPAQSNLFQIVHLERWTFNFSSAAHFVKQPEIKAVQGFHPETPEKG